MQFYRQIGLPLLAKRLRLAARFAFSFAFLATPPAAHAAQSATEFYRDNPIVLMVGSNPGGGYDAIARLIARHLTRFIPGNPRIIVQNTRAAARSR